MWECIFIGLKNNRSHYKFKECNNESYKSINGLNKNFPNTYPFSNGDVNKFFFFIKNWCLSLWIHEYMGKI